MDRALQHTKSSPNANLKTGTMKSIHGNVVLQLINMNSAAGHSHVDIFVSHCGNGTDRFNHVADHVDDGQVDDGPAGSKQ